jgi:ribosomal protein L34E
VPEKGDAAAAHNRSSKSAQFRRAAADDVRAAVLRAVRSPPRRYGSLVEFRDALLPILRRMDPKMTLGSRRLRALVVTIPGVRMEVRYTEREHAPPLERCPVCGAPVRPLRNQTLTGEPVELGYRCTRCAYWTHRKRRVPVRYSFQRAGPARSDPT